MALFNRTLATAGHVSMKVIRAPKAPLAWRARNTLRWAFLKGWIAAHVIAPFANAWGITTILSDLRITVLRANGELIDYGIVSYRLVTDTGVGFLVDAWQNTVELENMKYHGIGTSATAEAVGDTALIAESTTALNPDNTRATGTQSEPASNQLRSIGTLTADAQIIVREHGLLSQSATGGGVLWDRSVFATITLESADSIQCTYTVTITSGG
jgi:hypothetical protein